MRVTISPEERTIVEVTIAYANARRKKIRLPQGLHPVFSPLSTYQPGRAAAGLPDLIWDVVLHVQKDEQADLRRWLAAIANQGPSAFSVVAPEVESHLRSRIPREERDAHQGEFYEVGGVVLLPTLRDGGIIHKVATESVAAFLAYGTALVLDPDRGLTRRLGQCGWCGRFRLDFEGRPRTHCSETHRLAYDHKMAAERMRAWRQRRRKKRGGKGR